jgi:hypothetical protein
MTAPEIAPAPLPFGYGHSVPLVGATPLRQVREATLGPLGLAVLGRLKDAPEPTDAPRATLTAPAVAAR